MRALPRYMPALVTPFDRRGEIHLDAHRSNIARLWDSGTRGFLIAGSTGEGPYLEDGERARLTAAARATASRAFILCGVHAETNRAASRFAAEAAESGADAILLTTPTTLVRHRPDLIEGFFEDVIAATDLPALLYSVPKVTGVQLEEGTVARLALDPQIVGMKDSGGDPLRAERIVKATPDGFSLFIGATRAISLSIGVGAYGAITASANYASRLVRDTVTTGRRSPRAAEPHQSRLTHAADSIERHGIPGIKYAASRTGLVGGSSRGPLGSIDPPTKRRIRQALATAELG